MNGSDQPLTSEARLTSWRSAMLVVVGLLGAVVLVGLIVTLGEANRQRDRALKLQTHSFQVMIKVRSLATTMAEAEATLGRYVISADKPLGQLYSEQWGRASDQIDQLRVLTADNRAQNNRIAELRAAYLERGAELSDIALSTNYGKNDQALARYYKASKAKALDRISALIDEIIEQERNLLSDRATDAMQSVDRQSDVARILTGFGVLIVIGAIVLGWLTVRALGQRGIARAEADAERERAEELELAVAAATAELKQEAIERAAAEERLRQVQKMDAVGQLTGGIAHDFNNMLAVILGGLELARRQIKDGAPAARHIDSATEGANRAVALTRRLLGFSRAEALLPGAIEAGELISGMSDLLDRTLGGAIAVETQCTGEHWAIWADRHQLENALLNLAVNARDAMEGRGTLTIVTGTVQLAEHQIGECAAGDYVTIAVSDTGCGMAPEVMERVFEPFFTTKPIGKGTGLGLSQIFGFVRQSRGEIALQSHPGKGTTVTIYLPRYVGVASAEKAQSIQPAPKAAEHQPKRPSLDILVIEDDSRVLASTIGALKELGHRPVGCGDPLCAIDQMHGADHIDLIISDVLMPGKTGPEVIAELTPIYPDVAVLFVTGFAGDAGGIAEFGRHAVLRKPFTISALERAIDDAMAADRSMRHSEIAAE
ncbi:MAG: CHASE3 domain-containing protein [Sphingomonas sp.]|nr:CHASE3 domain-containing protein [Sphingomonas sp.]